MSNFLALVLLAAPSYAQANDTLTLEASYPSPSGVYETLYTKRSQFIAFPARADMNKPPMPAPGTLVYCKETDGYYASSANADAADPSTWWFRVQLDDTPENIFAQASMDTFSQPNNSYAYVGPLSVTVGTLYYYNGCVRSKVKTTETHDYTASATGRVCEILQSGSSFIGATASTSFRLLLNGFGAWVADKTSFTLSEAPDQESACAFDPADITGVTPAPKCYCAPFNMSGIRTLPRGYLPYVCLRSYGTKTTTTWNNARKYGGYVVHLDDIKFYQ